MGGLTLGTCPLELDKANSPVFLAIPIL